MNKKDELFGHYPEGWLTRFKNWNLVNPWVFDEFKKYAYEMRKVGRKKYSAEIIVNKIRWDHDLKTTGDVFKINNDFKSIMARLLIYQDDSFEGFFELRVNPNAKYIASSEQKEREAVLNE